MSTILDQGDLGRWLNGTFEDVVALQQSCLAALVNVRGSVFPTRENTV